jgi:RNA polymerase sigma-70 factor (ECF subfamily)
VDDKFSLSAFMVFFVPSSKKHPSPQPASKFLGRMSWRQAAETHAMPGEPISLQDSQAFEGLYLRGHLRVFRYIFGMYGGSVEEIEDLTAETFFKAWRARRGFSGDENAALGWVLKIARNLVVDKVRKEKNQRPLRCNFDDDSAGWEQGIPSLGLGPEEQALFDEQAVILREILFTLPVEQRELVVLRYILEWPVNRIANHLGILENTASVNIRRVLQRIRERWPENHR